MSKKTLLQFNDIETLKQNSFRTDNDFKNRILNSCNINELLINELFIFVGRFTVYMYLGYDRTYREWSYINYQTREHYSTKKKNKQVSTNFDY